MIDHLVDHVMPARTYQADELVQPPPQALAPEIPQEPVRPEQLQAVDAVFAGDDNGPNAFALLGAWSGTVLLADLAQEHFSAPPEEVKPPPTGPRAR
jgi:hypothetical protein